jgi:hypothetical protein
MGWLPRSNIKKDAAPDLLKGPAGWSFSGLNWFDDTPIHHTISPILPSSEDISAIINA